MGLFGRRGESRRLGPASRSPVRFEGVGGFMKLVTDGTVVFAIRADGTVYSWRPPENVYPDPAILGQGDNPRPSQRLGPIVGASGIRDIYIGGSGSLALGGGGDVYAWGIGPPFAPSSDAVASRPWRVELPRVQRLYLDFGSVVAVTKGGAVYTWGENGNGQLGLGDTEDRLRPVLVPELERVEELFNVWGEPYHGDLLYASTADGQLYEWRARNPHTSMSPTVPTVVPGIPGAKTREGIGATQQQLARRLERISSVMSAEGWIIAVGTDGDLYRWRPGRLGGLWNLGEPAGQRPAAERLGVANVRQWDGGVYAVDGDGAVWTWGEKAHGVLGLDSSVSVALPTRIPGLENVLHLSEGRGGVLAVTRDGSVWAWGSNKDGRLGVGDTRPRPRPVRVPGLSNIRTVVRDDGAAWYAIDGSGRLYSWGPNIFGRLGVGDEGERLSPTLVEGVPPVDHMAMLTMWSASAVTTDGELWSWGGNTAGELGVGSRNELVLRPKRVQGLSGVTATYKHSYMRLALTSTGHIFRWGW